eukprot:CAMPEP_0195060804 /NCGR_PEP_ID=MMETSP0448-20130528/7967_1 /TAXON_ID=66468 /ORGANISM="Heterocapsa triquestra, Strain CCMP 448" /LENGTH=390 /DNA_ID=CAMNT_0040091277 /DNA_START=145 /DNA_END=1319 /DNA_ORIENTATION=+
MQSRKAPYLPWHNLPQSSPISLGVEWGRSQNAPDHKADCLSNRESKQQTSSICIARGLASRCLRPASNPEQMWKIMGKQARPPQQLQLVARRSNAGGAAVHYTTTQVARGPDCIVIRRQCRGVGLWDQLRRGGGRQLEHHAVAALGAAQPGLAVLPAAEAAGDLRLLAVVLGDLKRHGTFHVAGPDVPPSSHELHLVALAANVDRRTLHRVVQVVEDHLAEVVVGLEHSSDWPTGREVARHPLVGDGEEVSVVAGDLLEGIHVAVEGGPAAGVHDLDDLAARPTEALLLIAVESQPVASAADLAAAEHAAVHGAVLPGLDVRRLRGRRAQPAHRLVGVLAGAALALLPTSVSCVSAHMLMLPFVAASEGARTAAIASIKRDRAMAVGPPF